MYKGAIFDMDGVLVDNLDCHVQAFQRLGREMRVDFTREQVRSVFGRSTVEMLEGMTGWKIAPEDGIRIDLRKEELYREVARPCLQKIMVPGLRKLLSTFRLSGIKTAVATSGPVENLDMVLDGLDLRDQFDAVVTGGDVKKGKPDPACFLLAAARIGISPRECLVFEDSISGIRAALAAGACCIALTTTYNREEIATVRPNLIVADFREVSELWSNIS